MMDPGIYEITRAEYDAIAAVNVSLLLAGPTMAHRKAYADGKRKPSDAMRFGTAMHCYLLEPERFKTDFFVVDTPPDRKSNWGKAYWGKMEEAFAKDTEDQETAAKEAEKLRKAASKAWDDRAKEIGADCMIDEPEYRTFEAMKARLQQTVRMRALTATPGRYEVVTVWKCPLTGLLCKGMLDKLIESIDSVVDLKRAVSADPFKFGKAAGDHGYDVRGAWYIDGLHALTGKWHDYTLLAQEPEYPYEPAMYRIERGSEAYRAGRWKYRMTIAAWAQCLKANDFPGYGNEVLELTLPKYHIPQNMMEEQDDDRVSNESIAGENPIQVESGAADRGDEEAGVFGVSA